MTIETAATWLPVIGASFAGVVTLLGGLFAQNALRKVRGQQPELEETTLEKRLEDLSKTMSTSSRLMEQVTAELEARVLLAEQLKKEAEAAEALAGLNKGQREAVARLVRGEVSAEIAAESRRAKRLSITIGFLYFAAGAAASYVITLLVGG